MEEIEGSLIEYLRLADVVYRCFGAAISMTFMNGLIVHSSAQFALRVYGENMNLLQMGVYMGWALLGFVTIAAPLNRHRTFYKVVIFLMILLAFCRYLLLYTRLYEGILVRSECLLERRFLVFGLFELNFVAILLDLGNKEHAFSRKTFIFTRE